MAINRNGGRPADPQPLARSAEVLRRHYGLMAIESERRLADCFAEAVGDEVAGRCSSVEVVKHELVVLTSEPAVADAIRWKSATLLAALGQLLGDESIEAVRVRIQAPTSSRR